MQSRTNDEVLSHINRSRVLAMEALWAGTFHLTCRDANGNEKWSEVAKNSLTYQGSEYILKKALDSASVRVTNGGWYYALYTAARDATSTVANATTSELGSAGYARGTCGAGVPTFDQNPSYWRASFASYTFQPGANDWASCWGIGIVDAASGNGGTTFLAFAAFSVARDLAPNDTLTVQYRLTLSSP